MFLPSYCKDIFQTENTWCMVSYASIITLAQLFPRAKQVFTATWAECWWWSHSYHNQKIIWTAGVYQPLETQLPLNHPQKVLWVSLPSAGFKTDNCMVLITNISINAFPLYVKLYLKISYRPSIFKKHITYLLMIIYLLGDKSFQCTKPETRVKVCSFLATFLSLVLLCSPVQHSSNYRNNWYPGHCPASRWPGLWQSYIVTSCHPVVWDHHQQSTVTGIQGPQLLRECIL